MGFAALDFATKTTRGNASKRIIGVQLSADAPREDGLLSEWATQIAEKFSTTEKELSPKNVAVALNNAIRAGVPCYGLQFVLVSGKPYAPAVPRKPRDASKPKLVKKKSA